MYTCSSLYPWRLELHLHPRRPPLPPDDLLHACRYICMRAHAHTHHAASFAPSPQDVCMPGRACRCDAHAAGCSAPVRRKCLRLGGVAGVGRAGCVSRRLLRVHGDSVHRRRRSGVGRQGGRAVSCVVCVHPVHLSRYHDSSLTLRPLRRVRKSPRACAPTPGKKSRLRGGLFFLRIKVVFSG